MSLYKRLEPANITVDIKIRSSVQEARQGGIAPLSVVNTFHATNDEVTRSTEHLLGFALHSNEAWTNYGEQQLTAVLDFGVLWFVHEHLKYIDMIASCLYAAIVRGAA